MRYLFRILFAATIAILGLDAVTRAKADTITTFDLNTPMYYGDATGTFTLDATTGAFTSGSLTASYMGQSVTVDTIQSQSETNGMYTLVLDSASAPGTSFDLFLPAATLVGYNGGAIESYANNPSLTSFVNYQGYADPMMSGELDLTSTTAGGAAGGTAAQTPEVATFVLLLTGLVPMSYVARRRRGEQTAAA